MALSTQATEKDYWISPTALYLGRNAMGYPDYLQASCVSGAQILVYVKGVIDYDAGHNYRRWKLEAAPTIFSTHTEKYVYAAIPRAGSSNTAFVVFPSERIDIYGKNASEEQIGSTDYYYIFLQGILSSSGENGTDNRSWLHEVSTGLLSSDEAIAAGPVESEWYKYSSVDQTVTFLKDLLMKDGTHFLRLFADSLMITQLGGLTFEGKSGEIKGIAEENSAYNESDKIVTPSYMSNQSLSRLRPDSAQSLLRFLQGIAVGEQTDGTQFGIAGDGVATLKEIISKVFTAGTTGSGFRLGNYGSTEDSYLEIDRLLVRKAAEFVKLVIRELQSVGGEVVLTPASMKCSKVEFLQKGVVIPGYGNGVPSNMYRCYFLQKDSEGNAVTNQFAAGDLLRCQTFNVKTGTTVNAKNRYYWRTLANVGTDYIDIYENRCDTNSDIPQEGDEIVQFGNVTDATRQSVIILSAYGDDSPSFKMYYGVDRFSLDGKEAFVLSRAQMFALADKFKFKTSEGETQSFAQILASVDGLQTTVTSQGKQIGSLGSQITQTATALRTEVSETYATKSAMNELQGTVDAQGNRITEVSSSITQTATNIALKVAETTAGMTNCIVGSALRTWDTYTLVHQNDDVVFYDGGVGGSRFARFSASGATANTYNGIKLECKGLKPSTQYTMSVWVRAHTVPDNGAYMEAAVGGDSIQYFLLNFTASEEWTLCKRTFTTPEQVTSANVALCLRKNGLIDVCRPMIEEGAEYHGWSLSPNDTTEAGNLAQAVKTTGIDIERGKITATADKFEVKNNRGETTASVSAKGVLEVNEGVFSGFIRKKITTITPDNIGNYSSVVNGYIEFDFSAAGSYVVFEGNFYAKFGGSYPVLVLPFYDPDNSLASKGVTADEALKYLGQTFIVVNRSNTTLVLAGFGTVNKKGSTATTGQNSWIDPNSRAIVTCNTQNKYSASGNTFKVLWDGTIYGQ